MSDIVLLDTESDFDNIKCISIPFNENVPEYYAISYRWGVHPEWKAQTPNYAASITSISKNNLIKLCQILRPKARYVWIDVVCINQADTYHRKMTIKNMDNIYRQSKRIIAIPDLCYCEENPLMSWVTKQDIDWAANEISRHHNEVVRKTVGWYIRNRRILSARGVLFIRNVIKAWACRCWVISERTIGVKQNKLDIIILRGNGTLVDYQHWKEQLNIDWNIDFDQATLIKTILNSASTKYIDRLFAILPHTKYRGVVRSLVDAGRIVDNMIDLKMTLLDILDMEGKMILLRNILFDFRDLRFVLPSFSEDRPPRLPFAYYAYPTYCCNIETTIWDGKRAIKVSGPYVVKSSPTIFPNLMKFFGVKVRSEVDIIFEKRQASYYVTSCESLQFDNSSGFWVVDSMGHKEVLRYRRCRYGHFDIY
ncbi:hypothetical protein EC973_006144 [Apophysomyces ossiformis]|uniref:Heterokaryon incompatibility domain-containing protein n=1 Tax=Apophysomyces ossiformis TaxID=679940 RepID=A0A8H7BJV4_9FUNG|nr:hypothetical protein EC973_006144 [Apophysomyces ossiformis]